MCSLLATLLGAFPVASPDAWPRGCWWGVLEQGTVTISLGSGRRPRAGKPLAGSSLLGSGGPAIWTQVCGLPIPRSFHTAVSGKGIIQLVARGTCSLKRLTLFSEYREMGWSWSREPSQD